MNPVSRIKKFPALIVDKEQAQPLDVAYFKDKGYILLKGLLTHEETQQMSAGVLRTYETGLQNKDLLANPHANQILFNRKIIEVAESLLGGKPTYFGEGSVSARPGSTELHRDNIDRDDFEGPDWNNDDYKIIKFAIYACDFSNRSGGMLLQRASHEHLRPQQKFHSFAYCMSTVGDVLVWDFRVLHQGGAKMLKGVNLPVHPNFIYKVPSYLTIPAPQGRSAIFFTVGIHNRHLDRYMTYLKTRTRFCNRTMESFYDSESLNAASKAGLEVFDLAAELREDVKRPRMPIGAHLDHLPLAYKKVYQVHEDATP